MTDIMETTDDQTMSRTGYATIDRDGKDDSDEESLGFIRFAYKLIESDPRVQALRDTPELTPDQHTDLRLTAMEIEQNIRSAQNDFKRLNPDATEAQVEEYIAAVFERDIATLDRIQKEGQRKNREEEEAEASDHRNSVTLNTTDIDQHRDVMENRFTGQGTKDGIRRILLGNY